MVERLQFYDIGAFFSQLKLYDFRIFNLSFNHYGIVQLSSESKEVNSIDLQLSLQKSFRPQTTQVVKQ